MDVRLEKEIILTFGLQLEKSNLTILFYLIKKEKGFKMSKQGISENFVTKETRKRFSTDYKGIFYRLGTRLGGKGEERIYYAVFKKDGKTIETKVGRQYADQMTPSKASRIRVEIIEGRRETAQQVREKIKESENTIQWTLGGLWEEYKLRKPNLKGITTDENRFQVHLKALANKKIIDITTDDVDQIRLKLSKAGKKDGTIKNVLELLRRIISFGTKKGIIEPISTTRLRFELPKLNNQKTEDLSYEQLESLLKTIAKNRHRPVAQMMELALYSGMRRSEIFNLKWNDINFERGYIYIRGDSDTQSGAKSGFDEKIPLNENIREILDRIPQSASPFVFTSRLGKPYVDVRKQANSIKREAGLPADFRAFHGLRHTFASLLASSGQVSMYELQKLLTHKSQAMTQRYAHLHDNALQHASSVIGHELKKLKGKKNEE